MIIVTCYCLCDCACDVRLCCCVFIMDFHSLQRYGGGAGSVMTNLEGVVGGCDHRTL